MSLFNKSDGQQIDVHYESDQATIHYTGPAVAPEYVGRLMKAMRRSTEGLPKRAKPSPRVGFNLTAEGESNE